MKVMFRTPRLSMKRISLLSQVRIDMDVSIPYTEVNSSCCWCVPQVRWVQRADQRRSDRRLRWSVLSHPQAIPSSQPLQLQPDVHPPRLHGAHHAAHQRRGQCSDSTLHPAAILFLHHALGGNGRVGS